MDWIDCTEERSFLCGFRTCFFKNPHICASRKIAQQGLGWAMSYQTSNHFLLSEWVIPLTPTLKHNFSNSSSSQEQNPHLQRFLAGYSGTSIRFWLVCKHALKETCCKEVKGREKTEGRDLIRKRKEHLGAEHFARQNMQLVPMLKSSFSVIISALGTIVGGWHLESW